eukprot:TRINITY_DN31082_c0_g1_i2.p1 TRINITY_DN31082_c0_g1~~TRINITY_DN31082_c0_g1_i2.p1  ORF type:complete len:384 (+),score=-17.56 TRINITY_DN31082_c0_g1_i2:80-1231(+)
MKLCKFFTLGTMECTNKNCTYSHCLSVVSDFNAHPKSPIKSVAVMPDGPQVLTGAMDNSIKVWNFSQGKPELSATVPTVGAVQHIEVKDGNTVVLSCDENLTGDPKNNVPVGIVKVLNPADSSLMSVKRSDEMPYTHPQSINSFVVLTGPDGVPYIISAGGEGLIRMWRFNANQFEHVGVLEGHIRGVTSLVLNDTYLWSGSIDTTIRVWDLNTLKCVCTLTSTNGGHTSPISCLVAIPPSTPSQQPNTQAPANTSGYIASGSLDGDVKIWSLSGELVWSGGHIAEGTGVGITSLHVFQDLLGGQQVLLVGLTDGKIMARSCVTMNLLFSLDITNFGPNNIHMQTVWSIASLGHSCFVSSDNTGRVIVWKAYLPLIDNTGTNS